MAFSLRRIGGSRFGNEERGGSIEQQGNDVVSGVWAGEGKVYISTNNSNQLTVTDAFPRSRWMERYHALVDSESAPIKGVFQNPRSPSQVYIVLKNSITHCMAYSNNKWTKQHTFQLSNAKGAQILSIMFHNHTSMFFWCEQRGASIGAASCCVCMREVSEDWNTEDFTTHISPVVAVIQCCPEMSLFIINKGVAMVPELPGEQKQLLFFWTFVPRSLKVHVWNCAAINSVDKTDFRSIIMHLLPIWNSFSPSDQHVLCLATHPTTLELIILDSSYTLSYASIQDEECCVEQLSELNVCQDVKQQAIRDFFVIGLYVGLVLETGVIEIFHSRSGVALCKITELQGLNLTVWHCCSYVSTVGIWASEGIWEIKSKSIPEIASAMQELDQCIQTEEETRMQEHEEMELDSQCIICEKCFPGFQPNAREPVSCQATMSGCLAATQFLQSWNQLAFAAKVALNSVMLRMLCSDTDKFRNTINKEHIEILLGSSFQSPVAALALFYNHPCYKDNVLSVAKSFCSKLESNQEDVEDGSCKTILSDTLHPYIKELVTLGEVFNSMIESEKVLPRLVSDMESGREEIKQILHKLNLSNPDSQLLSRLNYLQDEGVEEVSHALCYKMGLGAEERLQTPEMKVNSQRWRRIFRLEWKDGRWEKNRPDNTCNPSLSLLCNLLYNQEPDWLLKVYDKGLGMVNAKDSDERAKDYITQSIADSLPTLIVDPTPKSIYAHAVLLWTAGQEMQAMQVILRHQMWCQALDFFSSFPEVTSSNVVIFTMMLKVFLQQGASKEVLLKALSLAPQGFSAYELLLLFRENGAECHRPFVGDDQVLNIGDVRKQLNEMLTQ